MLKEFMKGRHATAPQRQAGSGASPSLVISPAVYSLSAGERECLLSMRTSPLKRTLTGNARAIDDRIFQNDVVARLWDRGLCWLDSAWPPHGAVKITDKGRQVLR